MFADGNLALGTMSATCGPASMLLPIDGLTTERTIAELPNTTEIGDAHLPSVDVILSGINNEESLQSDHLGKIA